MTREKKFGVTWTALGLLTLLLIIGIPLLAAGILLLIQGDRLKVERWIRALFWVPPAGLALAAALLLVFPLEGVGAEAGIARSILCIAPAFLALLVSLALGALTLARFPSLSRTQRIKGLGFGALGVAGAGLALVIAFPWPALGVAVLLALAWALWAWRRRRRARRAAALYNPAAVVAAPAPADPPPAPLAAPAPAAKPPRIARPLCGILAWALPLSAIPLGFLMLVTADTGGRVFFWLLPVAWAAIPLLAALRVSPRVRKSPLRILAFLVPPVVLFAFSFPLLGGDDWGWGALAWALFPLLLALCAAPILAIASLWRRERFPGLAVVALALYYAAMVLYGLVLAQEAFREAGALTVLIAGIAIPAAGLIWRRRRARAAGAARIKRVRWPRWRPGGATKRRGLGILLLVAAVALVAFALATLFGAVLMFLGGPDPRPSRMGECRLYGLGLSLLGLALLAGGIKAGRVGIAWMRGPRNTDQAATGS